MGAAGDSLPRDDVRRRGDRAFAATAAVCLLGPLTAMAAAIEPIRASNSTVAILGSVPALASLIWSAYAASSLWVRRAAGRDLARAIERCAAGALDTPIGAEFNVGADQAIADAADRLRLCARDLMEQRDRFAANVQESDALKERRVLLYGNFRTNAAIAAGELHSDTDKTASLAKRIEGFASHAAEGLSAMRGVFDAAVAEAGDA